MQAVEPSVHVQGLLREDATTATWAVLDPTGQPRHLRVLTDASPANVQRFTAVAGALRGLGHPNLVNVVAVVTHDGRPAALTELVAGRSVRDWSAEPHGAGEVLGVLVRVLRGLAALHRAGIAHGRLDAGCVAMNPGAEEVLLRIDGAVLGRPIAETGDVHADLAAAGGILREMVRSAPGAPALRRFADALTRTPLEPHLRTAEDALEHIQREPALAALLPPSVRRTRLHRSGPTLLPDSAGTDSLLDGSLVPPPSRAEGLAPSRTGRRLAVVLLLAVVALALVGILLGAPVAAVVLYELLS